MQIRFISFLQNWLHQSFGIKISNIINNCNEFWYGGDGYYFANDDTIISKGLQHSLLEIYAEIHLKHSNRTYKDVCQFLVMIVFIIKSLPNLISGHLFVFKDSCMFPYSIFHSTVWHTLHTSCVLWHVYSYTVIKSSSLAWPFKV